MLIKAVALHTRRNATAFFILIRNTAHLTAADTLYHQSVFLIFVIIFQYLSISCPNTSSALSTGSVVVISTPHSFRRSIGSMLPPLLRNFL